MRSIGFIGLGNMGNALARAVAARFPETEMYVYDLRPERINLIRKDVANARAAAGPRQVAEAAEVVVLAVKPQDIAGLLAEIGETSALVISIAVGVTLARLEAALPRARVVRVMPNTACLVGEMAAGYAFGRGVTEPDRAVVEALLSAAGFAATVDEPLLDAVTGLSGSGPAFVTLLMEAFMEAGRRLGLPDRAARELTLQTFLGTARLLQETQMEPGELVAMVSSPKGTTVAGREVLEASDVREVIIRTVEAAAKRSKELARS